jgi:hypothetical protein
MILIALLFAPTVPSDPRPQNLHWIVPFGETSISDGTGIDSFVTSSSMPTVKPFFGSFDFRLSTTAFAMPGVKSFDPRP